MNQTLHKLNRDGVGVKMRKYFENLVIDRVQTENDWKTVSDFLEPQYYGFEEKGPSSQTSIKKKNKVFSQSPERAKDDFVSSLASMAFNPLDNWVSYCKKGASNLADSKVTQSEKTYLENATKQVITTLSSKESNFYRAITEGLNNFVKLGPMYLFCERDKLKKTIRFDNIPLYQLYYDKPEYGAINLVYRAFELNARDLIIKYGEEIKGLITKDSYNTLVTESSKTQATAKKYKIVQATFMREDPHLGVDFTQHAEANFEFPTIYMCNDLHYLSATGSPLIFRLSGYDYNPYIICGYTWYDKSSYPTGLGHKVVSDIFSYNEQQKQNMIAGHTINMPPMAHMHGTLQNDRLNLSPGAMNAIKNSGATMQTGFVKPEPIYTVNGLPITIEMVREARELIREAFNLDLLQDTKIAEMTKGEYDGRLISKLSKLFGLFVNLEQNVQMPVADFTYDNLVEYGFLTPPSTLAGEGMVEPRYSNELHKVYNYTKVGALVSGVNSLSSISAMDPRVVAAINMEKVPLYIFENSGISLDLLKSAEDSKAAVAEVNAQAADATTADTFAKTGKGLESVARSQSLLNSGILG
jgi:hypothetical protein